MAKKQIDITLWGAWGRGEACPLVPEVHTPQRVAILDVWVDGLGVFDFDFWVRVHFFWKGGCASSLEFIVCCRRGCPCLWRRCAWCCWPPGRAKLRFPCQVYTPSGWPAVSTPVLRALAGKPGAAKKALAELDGADLALPEGGAQAPTNLPSGCLLMQEAVPSHTFSWPQASPCSGSKAPSCGIAACLWRSSCTWYVAGSGFARFRAAESDVLPNAEVPVEEMMADPAVAAMAAAGDGSDAPASLSSDPDLADLEGEWPVSEDIISERLGEQPSASSSSSTSGEGVRGSVSGSSGGSMDQGADADGAMLAAAHKAEAAAKGYGKLYGAFGGGREGLEACAAGAARPAGLQCAFITEGWPRGARGLRCGFGPAGQACRVPATNCYPTIDTLAFLVAAIASHRAPCMLIRSSTPCGLMCSAACALTMSVQW